MKRLYKLLGVLFATVLAFSCSTQQVSVPKIVPQPLELEVFDGVFQLTEETSLIVADNTLIPLAELFNNSLNHLVGLELNISKGSNTQNGILFKIDSTCAKEAYSLVVNENITLVAGDYSGLALGLSTLVQMLDVSSSKVVVRNSSISDKPDFHYRAVMLDLARFWHPVETIKETIDLLWFYKIPYLQLHFSDNRRFTFPLDDYPKLKTLNDDGTREYYTREELDDLVHYAKQRGIIIIPEVEFPGHSGQLFSKYPETFGTIDKKTGQAKYMHVVNIAKEEAYVAAEKIIKSLAEVFYTSPYIHIGCDEVYLEVLKTVPEYKPFCKKHNLKVALNGNANELFCYFINQLNEMVKATGKKSIIWEGFHGTGAGSQTINKDIEVIVWNTTYNHPDSLRKNGYTIINSTWVPWYMVGAMNLAAPQQKAYNWDVTQWTHWNADIPNIQLNSNEGISGGQISYWEQNHFKVIPVLEERVPVLAERLWNNNSTLNYTDFQHRFLHTNSRYKKLFHPVAVKPKNLLSQLDQTFNETAEITLSTSTPGTIKYYYSNSWNLPEMSSAKVYGNPFFITKSGVLSTQLFDANGDRIGFPAQYYYQKIEPAYNYKVFAGAPQHGWDEMPDFASLNVIREGVSGKMTTERLSKINNELFAKVKEKGHIDVRFNGLYNPYAVEFNATINCSVTDDYQFRIQTHDGLAELYIDDKLIGKGEAFANKPEDFASTLQAGTHSVKIKYYYKQIQNQLSILFKTEDMPDFAPFENLIQPLQ